MPRNIWLDGKFLEESLKLDSMRLSIHKVYFVLSIENVKCFGDINEDASKDSLAEPRLKGFITE